MHWLSDHKLPIVFALFATASIGVNIHQYLSTQALEANRLALMEERNVFLLQVASSSEKLTQAQKTIENLNEEIADLEEDKDNLREDLRDEKDRNDNFEDQIKDIAGTVGTLDKLSKTDKELLQKYSKVYFLNENYVPSNLSEISGKYVAPGKTPQYFHTNALPFLEEMIKEAMDDDVDLMVISAYRSFDHQSALKGQYTQVYGSGANTFSADQGYSEHQLGTTIDFGTSDLTSALASFADTEAYRWLLQNAHKYGFTLSYPEDNSFYIFEPWHWRFVGEDLARDLRRDEAHFYDWDQRDIDEYLISIFD